VIGDQEKAKNLKRENAEGKGRKFANILGGREVGDQTQKSAEKNQNLGGGE